ncbi:hypothetical protein G6L89_010430 [Agrobacterium fabrum]|uniref:hypothetical protein n=1 Tax=Agrobacterium fabrum TaxID=1176649 RepID=UPI00157404A3|nr:hypothetical protein [Agrobacterium fabrum]NTB08244.1 hypothetical protein [Agrobacterium fabrum]
MEEIERGSLELRFSNHLATPARDIAEVLAALSDDYAKLTKGRELVVVDMREGSLILALKDAIVAVAPLMSSAKDVVEGVMAVTKLAQAVRAAITKETSGDDRNLSSSKKRKTGAKSAEKLLQAALHSGGNVDFKYTENGDGSVIALRVTSAEARDWNERRTAERPLQAVDVARLAPPETPKLAQGFRIPDMRGIRNIDDVIQLARLLYNLRMLHLAGMIQNELLNLGRGELAYPFMEEVERLTNI